VFRGRRRSAGSLSTKEHRGYVDFNGDGGGTEKTGAAPDLTSGWASQDRPPATPSQRLKTDGPRALELQASALILVHNQVNQKKARPFQALDATCSGK